MTGEPWQLYGGRRVLFVMAAAPEYGPALKERIRPVMTGVGPVEAAVSTTLALTTCRMLPDLVVSLGSAGSASLAQGAVYQASSVSWRDMDASALGFAKGVTPFLDAPAEIALPTLLPGLPIARLSTGGNVVSGDAYEAIDADMVDMETYSVFRAASRFGVPVIALRGISDGAEELRHYEDWTALLPVIDERLAEAVDALEAVLPRVSELA
ncbi:5'-methylthioadenosine/S-adenosylhomocysteine nucleosidase [Aureimonas sp. ME7]|uniref:5'-methylthioadenosine/S-adenosylhomocysteine nucleosidase n=1 Tax=Aureimonas sp. ME7 TaxID=2744252 RepID=UPI0024556B22|nr:5'-methylthioadenosine/S-adenosylhomocysteine nucleosidase [Aureimonas sp. ME7]